MLMLVTSIQTACSKCPMATFCTPGSFCGMALFTVAVLIWALGQVGPDPLHTVLQFRKCRSALVCNTGTYRASHLIRDSPVE